MVYIGSTTNYQQRIKLHIGCLKGGKHIVPKLQDDFNKYGLDSFTFDVISTNNDKRKEDKEFEIIRSYREDILYNVNKGKTNNKQPKQKRIKLTAEIRFAIKQYRLKHNLTQYYFGSLIGYCDASVRSLENFDEYILENKAKKIQYVTGIIIVD